jgi:HEAT repeat protein
MKENINTKELRTLLGSGNEDRILEAIQRIRFSGSPELLPAIIELTFKEKPGIVRGEAIKILNDLKDKNAVSFITEALVTYRGKDGYRDLVCACWQNGLDYSDHLDFFMDILIHDEFEIAMEAFTVIEENIHLLEGSEKQKLAAKATIATGQGDNTRSKLIRELIPLLQDTLN